MIVNLLTIGDIVGTPGRKLLRKHLKRLVQDRAVDLVVANAENVANGSGITRSDAEDLFASGVDVITTGDHVWRKKEVIPLMEQDRRVLRAANLGRHCPGRGSVVVSTARGIEVGVLHLLGRVFMPPADCPFAAADDALLQLRPKTPVIVVDMHCEATSEKIAMGRYLDGRVSVVFGTHTHVPTADIQIFPKGTGYITDLGMTGPYDSVLGRRVDRVLKRFVTGLPSRFEVAAGDERIGAALFTVEHDAGRCVAAERIEVKG
ncbi:MAG: TIGR00282 family metallophosphoesterase [Planctomycetota bacterium]